MLWYATGRQNPGPVCSRETVFGVEIFLYHFLVFFLKFPWCKGLQTTISRFLDPNLTGNQQGVAGTIGAVARNMNCLETVIFWGEIKQ